MRVVGAVVGNGGARDFVVRRLVKALDGRIQLRKEGIPKKADMLISWRFNETPALRSALADGLVIVCLDFGYFDPKRHERFSISINGIHGLSLPVPAIKRLPTRWHPTVRPWRKDGEFIQIISPGWVRDGGIRTAASDLPVGWLNKTAHEASRAFLRPARIRHHPNRLPPREPRPCALEHTFEETYVSVTYSSTAAVQTVLAGVPTVIQHPRCPAFIMGSPMMEVIKPNDRAEWAHDLSYREYGMVGDDELDAAVRNIVLGYEEPRKQGPMIEPLRQYGIRS